MAPTEHLVHLYCDDEREQKCQVAERQQQHVGDPGPHGAPCILYVGTAAAAGPARIAGLEGKQRHAQVEAQGYHGQQGALTQAQRQLLTPRHRHFLGCSFLQNNASIWIQADIVRLDQADFITAWHIDRTADSQAL